MKNIFKNISFHEINFNILGLLFSGLVLRLFLANFGTLQLDYGTFVAWSNSLAQNGLKNFYTGWSDYLPGYLYILYLLGKINLIVDLQVILFKFPAILTDLATGYLIYKIVGKKHGLLYSALYIFNPAIFANSSLWGQVDSLTAFFSVLSVYFFRKNIILSAIFLSLGTIVKPQAAFVLPAILYLFIKEKRKFTDMLLFSLSGLIIFVLGFTSFNGSGENIIKFIFERLSISANQYPYGSVNAFSFWGLLGFWKSDNVTFWLGLVVALLVIIYGLISVLIKKPEKSEYLLSSISLLATFFFMTRMHERHLLPILAPLLISASVNPLLLVVYCGLSFTYLANLSYAYYWISDNFKEIFNPLLVKLFIITNLSLLVVLLTSIYKKVEFKFKLLSNLKSKTNKISFSRKDITSEKAKWILLGVIIFSFISRIYTLGIPKEKYFDEIYHAFTAGLMLNGDPKAWEWWNPHPEGFAYEWTHPPIAKLGMVLGMEIFGENAFGWRIVQAILGVGSVALVYLIAIEVFKDKLVGILSSVIFSLDGLPLVMSRIGMNDSYLLFFSLLSIYLFIRDKNFFSSVSFGLAISSKWSAIYTLPILFISHFVFKKKIKIGYISFLVVPIAVYIGSYTGMFLTGHTWGQFLEVQRQMWWYHTNLVAEHPYTSPAWSWPLLLRPIYLYNGLEYRDTVSRIYAFGNPAIFWFGLFSIILSFLISAKEKVKKLAFIVFSYLVFFLPWMASPRIMFLYHYLPAIPFLSIASGYILRRFPKAIVWVLSISAILFIYFYPHWTGIRISESLDKSYYWFSSWR